MKWVLYNLLFAAVYPFLLPGFLMRMLKRGGYAARMGDRFALYPRDILAKLIPDGKPVCPHSALSTKHQAPGTDFVWIHAVSVGEVQVAGQLMREWRKADPSVRFCFSTTSSTGWKIAERELEKIGGVGDDGDLLIYNPLDFPNFVKSALKTVRPRAIVLTESEIWPNFILQAKKTGIPLFLINARVSDRSAPRYKFARCFFRDVFGAFTKIFAQSDLDASRIRAAMGIDVAEVSRPPRGGQEPSATRHLFAGSYFDNDILKTNAQCAVALMRAAGLNDANIAAAFREFVPLPHRMNIIAEIDGVEYIDDSKATSLSALAAGVIMASTSISTSTSTSTFNLQPSIRLIAGGLPKGDDPKSAVSILTERVKKVYLIGQSAEAFAAAWKSYVDCEICGTMEAAVAAAKREAATGDKVLLSPGTASFDQFKSFGERGDVFARLVKKEK